MQLFQYYAAQLPVGGLRLLVTPPEVVILKLLSRDTGIFLAKLVILFAPIHRHITPHSRASTTTDYPLHHERTCPYPFQCRW
jgi:hypothetical protein